jgi:asparagine synthase (glutamine-hydrolysing)
VAGRGREPRRVTAFGTAAGFRGLCGPADRVEPATLGGFETADFPERPEPFRLRTTGGAEEGVYRIATGRYVGGLFGEWYGIERLARDLGGAPGSDLPGLVALAADRWPDRFPARLHGLFALALWDTAERRLLLYRDGSCARGLYYHLGPSGILSFATRLDDLMALPAVEKRLSRRSLHEYLRFLDISTPNTIYDGVYSVEPGTLLIFREGQGLKTIEIRPETPPTPVPTGLDAAADVLESLLADSVAARLDPQGTTGVFLSGGIDSSLLCGTAARLGRDRIEAVTVGFREPRYDEMAVAARIADHLQVPHHRLYFDEADYAAAFERLTAGVEQPYADPAALPTLLAFEFCRERFGAVLDGTGSDTLLGVMPARHARFAIEFGARLPEPARRLLAATLRRLPGLSGYAPLFDFAEAEEVLIRWNGFRKSEIEALCGEPVSLAHTRFYRVFAGFPKAAHFERYSALLGNLPDDRIHQAAGLTGLKVRFPYWDPHVESFVRSLPADFRYSSEESKVILRRVLGRRVPKALWNLPKHGFDFPYATFLSRDNHRLVRRFLEDSVLTTEGGLVPAVLDGYLQRYRAGDPGVVFRIWGLVMLAAWLERHKNGA